MLNIRFCEHCFIRLHSHSKAKKNEPLPPSVRDPLTRAFRRSLSKRRRIPCPCGPANGLPFESPPPPGCFCRLEQEIWQQWRAASTHD